MEPRNPGKAKSAGKTNPTTGTISEKPAKIPPSEPVTQPKSPQRAAVDALFQNEANLRQAVKENLKTLRAESEDVAKRVQVAFDNFNPSNLSTEERARRHYVAPGTDPYKMLEAVVIKGTNALRSAKTDRAITFRNTTDLKKLIKKASKPTDSLSGVAELAPLVDFINSKSKGSSLVTEPTYTLCKAELEADKILDVIEKTPAQANGDDAANTKDSSSKTHEADQFVKDHVDRQMKSATAPESQLAYGKIPNSAGKDKVQSEILKTFQLRPGASDVTSYHDFHTLQIAFEHVWTEIFDGKLASLGRDLYGEYVKLKDFTGSSDPDPSISTLDDLKRLIEQVKSLSNFADVSIPGNASDTRDTSGEKPPTAPKDWTEQVKDSMPPEVRASIEFFESIFRGTKIITWNSFPLSMRGETIRVRFEEDAVAVNEVEIVMEPVNVEPWKFIHFREFDSSGNLGEQWQVSNDIRDKARNPDIYVGSLPLWTHTLRYGTLEFFGERDVTRDHISYYVLVGLTEKIKDRMRVTFTWSSQ